MAVFHSLVGAVEEIAKRSRDRWDDERLVWIPLNFGLEPPEYDTQQELNSILAQLTGRQFTHSNQVRYLHNDRGYYELERMVRETICFHVLHIHDISGRVDNRDDRISWRLVVDGYIAAFIEAVRAMDAGERRALPQFLIFLDEFYYHQNGSRDVLTFLEHLYDPGIIRIEDRTIEAKVRAAHKKLLDAIAASPTLRDRGEAYLRKHIVVHVNVTNTFDPTYTADAIARDHRKLAFRDVFEDNPSCGEALFSGMGVGEHYVGPCWEDRTLLVRGPDLVYLKTDARELYLSQGYDSSEVPTVLRARAFPPDYDEQCVRLRERGWNASLTHVVNQTGFGPKQASIVKAALYNLMLPGTIIIIPDSIWACDFWAGMLMSAALRGCHVYAIAPAREQAPSDATFTLEMIRKTLKSLVRLARIFDVELAASGGSLQVGLYHRESDVHDIKSRMVMAQSHGGAGEWDLKPFGSNRALFTGMLAAAGEFSDNFADSIRHLVQPEQPCKPHLHEKEQYFVSHDAAKVLDAQDWQAAFSNYFGIRRREVTSAEVLSEHISPPLSTRRPQISEALDSAILVMSIGSHNQDRRSQLLDGEVLAIATGEAALTGVADFVLTLGSARRIVDPDEVDKEYPRATGLLRAFVKLIKDWI